MDLGNLASSWNPVSRFIASSVANFYIRYPLFRVVMVMVVVKQRDAVDRKAGNAVIVGTALDGRYVPWPHCVPIPTR